MTVPAQGDNDEFLEVMRETRARYVAGFAGQLDHMRRLSAGSGGEGELAELRTVAHRLAGLSGTLGFKRVGAEAAGFEDLIDHAIAGRAFDRDAALDCIQRLSEAFDAENSQPPPWAGGQA
jgi:HPt (histidine-containing phosphotransfer) domain-containing protein